MGKFTDRRSLGFEFTTSESGTVDGETLQCCHCGGHFTVNPGSKKRRGFCMNCGAVTCGKEKCAQCTPLEKKLDLYEGGKLDILR